MCYTMNKNKYIYVYNRQVKVPILIKNVFKYFLQACHSGTDTTVNFDKLFSISGSIHS